MVSYTILFTFLFYAWRAYCCLQDAELCHSPNSSHFSPRWCSNCYLQKGLVYNGELQNGKINTLDVLNVLYRTVTIDLKDK